MSSGLLITLMVILLFVMLLTGNWVFVSLGAAAYLGLVLQGGMQGALANKVWQSLNSSTLAAIPSFIFMGEIIVNSGMAKKLYSAISKWSSFIPGGLLHTNIISSAIFAAISGSSVATAATIGTVAKKDQLAMGYNKSLIIGSIGGAGTLGILIPPSINMIVYGAWVECSIGRLFMGGVVPGVILAGLFSLYVGVQGIRHPDWAPRSLASWNDRLESLKDIVPLATLVLFVMLGIYTGFATPTEIAGVACIIAVILSVIVRKFTWSMLFKSMLGTSRLTAMLMFIYFSAQMLAVASLRSGITVMLPIWVAKLELEIWQTLIGIYCLYIILGCFFDGLSMLVISLPFVLPILNYFEVDLLWFGVTYVILAEMSFLTPPVGLNLYILQGIFEDATFGDIIKSCFPFFVLILIMVVLLTVAPGLATWLPTRMIK